MENDESKSVVVLDSRRPFDDLNDLYVGHVSEIRGSIEMDGDSFIDALFGGEVLLYGHVEEGGFVVERIRRVALSGRPLEPPPDDPIGILSLSGPLIPVALEPGPAGAVDNLYLQLHYRALSLEKARCVSEDAVFPQVKRAIAHLHWSEVERLSESTVQIELELPAITVVDPKLGQKPGIVGSITLEPFVLTFHKVGSGSGYRELNNPAPNNPPPPDTSCPDDLDHCPPPDMTGPDWLETVERRLPIKFINLTKDYPGDVVALCNDQIGGVCEVWRDKAALDLTVWPNEEDFSDHGPASLVCGEIDEATAAQKEACHEIPDFADEYSLLSGLRASERIPPTQWGHVEIYLVDALDDRPEAHRQGGGATHDCGQPTAFCILQADKAAANKYLLAHELGHVLGLNHPEGSAGAPFSGPCADLPTGSWESIMKATGSVGPNLQANTLYNCRIFGMSIECCDPGENGGACAILSHNNIVKTTIDDGYYFHPDSVDHFVGDFPGDNGIEPSMPLFGQDRWSNSSIWNRRSAGSGETANGPEHEDPSCTGPNRMYVRLAYKTEVRDPVCVDLYLADPGVSPGHEQLVPLKPPGLSGAPGHRLFFDPPPTPSTPIIKHMAWMWNDVLDAHPGYPKNCCVFAIAHSVDEPLPFADPTAVTFGDVFPLLGADNDVAQRNLHVQSCTTTADLPLSTLLPWVQLANPFDELAPVRLEVAVAPSAELEALVLEVNGEPLDELEWEGTLQPADRRTVRLRATLPAGAPVGTAFPIDLRLWADGQLITGYRHVLRVAPLTETVAHVLDTLFGALRDVRAAFLADRADEHVDVIQDSLEMLVGMADDDPERTLVELALLGGRFLGVVNAVESSPRAGEPGHGEVPFFLQQLADRLVKVAIGAPPERLAPDVLPGLLVEEIREWADRIQQPAGRLARGYQLT